MTSQYPAWPPTGVAWPESQTDSTGLGPDFPGSSGDRERGRFRPGSRPRLTAVAVVGDDGQPIGADLTEVLDELRLYMKALVLGFSILTDTDLLEEVSD